MGALPPLKPMPIGYGGALVGGMSLVWQLRARHVILLAPLARPTPGFKPTPMGPRPKSKPPGCFLGRFPSTHAPYPMALGSGYLFQIGKLLFQPIKHLHLNLSTFLPIFSWIK
ncbi:hypothetical protein Hanom_Chr13g01218451 [Helianthus anomalus]